MLAFSARLSQLGPNGDQADLTISLGNLTVRTAAMSIAAADDRPPSRLEVYDAVRVLARAGLFKLGGVSANLAMLQRPTGLALGALKFRYYALSQDRG